MLKIGNNVYCYRLYHFFNVYVIKGNKGDILIDTGFCFSKRKIDKIFKKNNIKLVILTHAHIDHTWNASYIKNKYNCKIYISEEDIKYLDNSLIKAIPVNNNYKYRTKLMQYGMDHLKQKEIIIDKTLKDNEIINKYGINFKIYSLKGHTNGSIGILYKDILFAGDAIVNRKPYIELSYQMQDKISSLKTVDKILKINPNIICVGHERPFKISKLRKSLSKINKQYNKESYVSNRNRTRNK